MIDPNRLPHADIKRDPPLRGKLPPIKHTRKVGMIAPMTCGPKPPEYYKEHMSYVEAFNRAVAERDKPELPQQPPGDTTPAEGQK